MKCENCGASVPRDLGACPECGVFARVTAPEKKKRSNTRRLVLALLLVAAAIGAVTYWFTKPPVVTNKPLPVRVVHDRPGGARKGGGATINEPEAILRLQRSFALKPDCVAIMSKGFHDGAYELVAVNRCDGTRLGKWLVDGKTGDVRAALPK